MLKPYAELESYERHYPCLEYPGKWVIYIDGNDAMEHESFSDALNMSRELWEAVQGKVSIAWICTEGDPRVGQVWFTGFYIHGEFDQFGNYRTSAQ